MSKQVQIPFMVELEQPLIEGKVLMTSQTRKYGGPADIFTVAEQQFKILAVIRLELEFIARNFHEEHGFKSPDAYRNVWKKLHPRKGFIGNQYVFTHIFRKR